MAKFYCRVESRIVRFTLTLIFLSLIGILLQFRWSRTSRLNTAPLDPSLIPKSSLSSLQDPCRNLYEAVCQTIGNTADPTGVVDSEAEGELRVLNIYSEIVQHNPGFSSEQANEELARKIYQGRRKVRFETAFYWVKHALERFIFQQPSTIFTLTEKRQLAARIRQTRLEMPPPASLYSDEPDLLKQADAIYERTLDGKTRIRVGGAYLLIAKSWFNVVFTLAHELAHGIDPCEIRFESLKFPAYDRITSCFLKQGLIAAHKTRSECGRNDQLSETFADWIAVQIVATSLEVFSTEFQDLQLLNALRNSVKDLCEEEGSKTESDLTFHPHPRVRIEKILGMNPRIRQLFGCNIEDQDLYCDFDWTPSPKSTFFYRNQKRSDMPKR